MKAYFLVKTKLIVLFPSKATWFRKRAITKEVNVVNGKSFLTGLLTGAFFSGLITLLTTPNSGKEASLKLKNTTESFTHQLSEIQTNLHRIQKDVASATIEGKETIRTFVSELNTIVTNWKQEIGPHQVQLQKELASLEETIEKLEASLSK